MKYKVYAIYTASKMIGEIEADSKEEAIGKMEEGLVDWPTLCHQCSHEIELNTDPWKFEAEEVT